MSSRSILSSLGAIGIVMTLASVAAAQDYQPFIEAGYFDHDLQFFAPASDIDTYDDDPVLRTGWFGSYNRMYIGVSRPEDKGYPAQTGLQDPLRTYPDSSDLMDLTWGNRWDLGYMIDDVDHDHGWMIAYMHIDGPNDGQRAASREAEPRERGRRRLSARHGRRHRRRRNHGDGHCQPAGGPQRRGAAEPAAVQRHHRQLELCQVEFTRIEQDLPHASVARRRHPGTVFRLPLASSSRTPSSGRTIQVYDDGRLQSPSAAAAAQFHSDCVRGHGQSRTC